MSNNIVGKISAMDYLLESCLGESVQLHSKMIPLYETGLSQTWGESTFNDSESESNSGRLFDSESDSGQFGYDSESNSDSSNISISDSESDSNFQSSTDMKLLLGNFATRIESSKRFTF